ncbi:MAG: FAD-dependent oxidoreductase [Clostridia bacterium]
MPTIFEKEPALGGSLRWLASEKRVDKALLDSELEKIERSGISVICNVQAGATPDIKALFAAGYESVLFAIGETRGRKPDLENAGCRGVFEAVSLMGKLVGHEKVCGLGRQVVVTGGDELAFDTARMLKAAGAQVIVLSPCSREMLKAGAATVAAALDQGIDLVTGTEVIAVKAADGHLTGVVCRVPERKVDIEISCDTLVFGETGVPDTRAIRARNSSLDIDENGYIQVNEKLITSMYGVFASGGLRYEPAGCRPCRSRGSKVLPGVA